MGLSKSFFVQFEMIDIHYLDVGMPDYINEERDRKKQIISSYEEN